MVVEHQQGFTSATMTTQSTATKMGRLDQKSTSSSHDSDGEESYRSSGSSRRSRSCPSDEERSETKADGKERNNETGEDGGIRSPNSSCCCSPEQQEWWNFCGPYVVLLACMVAAGFNFIASWSCNTFYGAEMPWFVGGGYGIWSLQDSRDNCQLWSVLFFAYDLDAPLRAARFLSMTSMLTSLAAIAILTQVIAWGRIGSWIVAIALIYWLADSIAYWWRFNIWSTFFILTYFFMVLVTRCFLLEYWSPRTLWKNGRRLFVICTLTSAGIFFILLSNVCMCDELTENDLEKHDDTAEDDLYAPYSEIVEPEFYERPENCSGMCVLGPTSKTAIATPFLWIATWILSRFIPLSLFSNLSGNQKAALEAIHQAEGEKDNEEEESSQSNDPTAMVDQCPHDYPFSSTTKKDGDGDDSPQRSRPRLGTATTYGTSEDDEEEDRLQAWNHQHQHQHPQTQNDGNGNEAKARNNEENMTPQSSSRNDSSGLATITESSVDDTDLFSPRNDGVTAKGISPSAKSSPAMEEAGALTPSSPLEDEDVDTYFKDQCYDVVPSAATSMDDHESDFDDYSGLEQTDSTIASNQRLSHKRKPNRWRRMEHLVLGIVVFLYSLIVLVMVGTYFENKNAGEAPDTSYNFITDVVCAFDPVDPNAPFETFDNTTLAEDAGYTVAHCGDCGDCSNAADIKTYVDTRKTVAESAKKCSVEAIFGKDSELMDCLEREIGFTRSCTGCWADNMRTTAKYCMWTCLSSMLIGVASSNTVEDAQDYDWLNQCVFCDEKRSGPEFVTCSGVARRRLGIQSEFERNPLEQCPNVDIDYLASNWTNYFGL